MFGLVGQMRRAVFHAGDAAVGIGRAHPLVVGNLLVLAGFVELSQFFVAGPLVPFGDQPLLLHEPREVVVPDRTERGRKLRMLVVIDEFTRESLAIEVAWSFTAERVIEVLQYVFAVRGAPKHLRSDNGPEFVAQAVTRWLDRAGVKTLFIAKGSPWENGYVESFNSRFRDELLDRELFLSLADARWVVDRWRLDYNHHRPHSSLDYQTPAAFAARCAASAPERASATPQLSPPLQQHSGPLTKDPLIHAGT